ncbi:uncharacterized protein LOC126886346 [Diabrotica virgifera virgifera]|uniref:Integrase catalytic domain-containing protein n=1 Tax=Diabrotica virgifera virgifera TaxID=50390 RepID=A0ABM5KG66_DIAVI|nr:uncharacterized protein LOC126886346 [Diabrotica virgifera virgifera]
MFPSQILNSETWWHGPSWIILDSQFWPNEQFKVDHLPELKTQTLLAQNAPDILSFPFDRFSNFSKMCRVTSYIFRFVNNCANRNNRKTGVLTLSELKYSLNALIKVSQNQSFCNEIKDLSNNKYLASKNRLCGLTPFLDRQNILRVGGRLKYSDYNFNKKHPILINGNHHFTKLLFQEQHLILLHGGAQLLLNTIRDIYWPTSGRNLARATVRKCVRCFRFNAKTIQPIMGNLPSARVMPSSPFTITGVDYAGPFLIKDKKGRGCKTTKCYIGLFICFSTKAVHLELISSLSSEAFLQALRRFVSRRGKPEKIFSDNGSNFIGAQRELASLLNAHELRDKLWSLTNSLEIEWQFIPPYSPHFGGLWEAGVKSSKLHLKRVLSKTALIYEEFQTLIIQIEAILNSRPLSPISPDPNDISPLTPAHFLIGKPIIAVPDQDLTDIKVTRLNRYQLLQQMCQSFWARWKTEYISQLQVKGRWKKNQESLTDGALVLIKDDNINPTHWQLGRIFSVHPGRDNINRVATIKTSTGIIKRGFNKICPLPLDD